MADLDHAHEFINVSVAKEAAIRLQRYVEAQAGPDKKATNTARIIAADACRSAAAYLGGDIVILERDGAIEARDAAAKLPKSEARIAELEAEVEDLKGKLSRKKRKARSRT